MKKLLALIGLAILANVTLLGQINEADNSVQVISYWDLNEEHTYHVTIEKNKVKKGDTTVTMNISYDVQVKVIDSTANGYLVEWKYGQIKSGLENELLNKLSEMSSSSRVVIKTDELGIVQGVENWKEVRDLMQDASATLLEEFKDEPKVQGMMEKMLKMYSSKEVIEANAIKEIQLFHNFHGAKYEYQDTLELAFKLPNNFKSSKPFDTQAKVCLIDVDTADYSYTLSYDQQVDSEQLTKATKDYMKKMGIPKKSLEAIKELQNNTSIYSVIHNTGWVLYSEQEKTVSSMDILNIEKTTIEFME